MQSGIHEKWGIIKAGVLWIGTFLLLAGAVVYLPQFITVSNSVNGRELPIYCVETDKKVVGLSFDAAWVDL